MTFTEVFLQYITVDLIPSIILIYPFSPHYWNCFNESHFSTFIHQCTLFSSYSLSHTLSLYPTPATGANLYTGLVLASEYPLCWEEWPPLCPAVLVHIRRAVKHLVWSWLQCQQHDLFLCSAPVLSMNPPLRMPGWGRAVAPAATVCTVVYAAVYVSFWWCYSGVKIAARGPTVFLSSMR